MSNEYLNNKELEKVVARFKQSKQDRARLQAILDDLNNGPKRRGRAASLRTNTLAYDQANLEFLELQNILAIAFFTLSDNLVRYAKFSHIDPDDAIQDGVIVCFEKIDRFDPTYRGKNGEYAKLFNYLTTIILNSLRQVYRTARNYTELKRKYRRHLQSQVAQSLINAQKGKNFMGNGPPQDH